MSQNALNRSSSFISVLPVVVHVVYKTNGQNISDAQIQSQIDVLNEDFARQNADTTSTPAAFRPAASATNFRFCLAQTDPFGNPTTGIERRMTTVTSFSTNDDVKTYSSGGMDAWDMNRYFNIWVCKLSGGILGYGEFPASAHTNTYGVVINYDAFGRTGLVSPPYNMGRTSTHEIGHCFNLKHIWGDDGGGCTGSDYVTDTPNQSSETYGCRSWPAYDACTGSSGNGYMYMNYMDYSDDNCLNMFTVGQATRMANAMSLFYPTLLTSTACESVNGLGDSPDDFRFNLYPNPSSGIINVDMFYMQNIGEHVKLTVTDLTGRSIMERIVHNPNGHIIQLDLTGNNAGIYFITISNDNYNKTQRFMITN